MTLTPKQLYDKRVGDEINIHREKLNEFKELLLEEQKKCRHRAEQFNPDASGNNDSYYECINCGKRV